MAKSVFEMFLGLSFVLMLSMSLSPGATDEDRKAYERCCLIMSMMVYIAYLGSLPERDYSPSSHHFSMLQAVIKQSSVANYLIRSYKRSFNGFAAKLTNEEANKLASMKEVVSIFPNKVYHLQTTRSWDFLGLKDSVKRNPTVESDVIIGVIDSGIWPESESFSDKGFGPAPKKWKGSCSGGKNFTCNNKLIGARFYNSEEPREESARDGDGHGTHTASTAAGNNVEDASFFGLAQGTARGGVPSSRIAAYKVCKQNGCASADILAAFDDAIADGVDLITISVGSTTRSDFYQDSIAIGAFHAAEKGILTVQSAGNEGRLGKQGVTSVVPWILTVAASSIDLYGKEIANLGCNEEITARVCETGCLNSTLVKEKIVLCDQFRGNNEARDAGAAGSILKTEIDDVSFVLPLAASALSTDNYESVKSYLNSTKRPVAEILRSETIEDSAAPVVAPFSSRGPNFMEPDIMKPDLSAPGVDILAAFSPIGSPSGNPADKRQVKYSILSGTSMSCPHAAAVAAYVKTFHPEWSPSAIQSALMTTAFPMDQSTNPDGELAYGSGHVNPVKATDPGLVYEVVKGDYIKFLCSIGYDSEKLRRISGDNSTCSKTSENILPRDLNYPSLTAQILPDKSFTVGFHRTVTNVGIASSTYKAKVSSNSKLEVKVDPEVLSFKALMEKKSFNVTVTGDALSLFSMVSASLEWSDGTHSVKSPIVIHSYKSFRLEGSTL
ncbi:Peptidase S8/S53 domain - like 10 [Theobroma cacao]|nr:Peptidase S8/S53 domain - like 10 [Theobroma cacao]